MTPQTALPDGLPTEPETGPVTPSRRACLLPGCGRPHLARGYCRAHYLRWQRHGTPLPDVPVADRRYDTITYRTAHAQVRADRGPASAHRCTQCGQPAVMWCYDGTDPAAGTDRRGRRFSLDSARYQPRCRSCHRPAAGAQRRVRRDLDGARAERLYRAGATARGIAALLRVSPSTVLAALRDRDVPIRPAGRTRRSDVSRHQHDQPSQHPNPDHQTTHHPDQNQHATARHPRSSPTARTELLNDPRATTRPLHRDPTVGAASPDGPPAQQRPRS